MTSSTPTPARFAIAAAAFLIFALLGVAVRMGWTDATDMRVMALVRGIGGASLRGPVVAITTLGNAPVLLGIGSVALLFLLASGERWQAARLALIVLGGRLAVEFVKDLVTRARPPLIDRAVAAAGWSFPSAHAANATVTCCALAFILTGRRRAARPALLTLAALIALAIGASRVWLGVHWPVDVLAGWLFGIGWLALGAALPLPPPR